MVSENMGRGLRDWILFAIGCGIVVAVAVNSIVRQVSPDPVITGIALILLGYGHLVLRNGGGS